MKHTKALTTHKYALRERETMPQWHRFFYAYIIICNSQLWYNNKMCLVHQNEG